MNDRRLLEVTGTLHGYKFVVKPAPLNAAEQYQKTLDMLDEWKKKHKGKSWTQDKEFRASFFKAYFEMACEWVDELKGEEAQKRDNIFERDDFQKGQLDEAVEFFLGFRVVPNEMLQNLSDSAT